MEARDGEHTGEAQYNWSSSSDSFINCCRFGITSSGIR
jgi:hypothetical protein